MRARTTRSKNHRSSRLSDLNKEGLDRLIAANEKERKMGRFSVEFEIANNTDIALASAGMLEPRKVRRRKVNGLVDPGATRMALPQSLVKQLGLEPAEKLTVSYADGRESARDVVFQVYVEIMGRSDTFSAVVEPGRKQPLIGAIVLESLDFLVDCKYQRLVPRDPKTIISEA